MLVHWLSIIDFWANNLNSVKLNQSTKMSTRGCLFKPGKMRVNGCHSMRLFLTLSDNQNGRCFSDLGLDIVDITDSLTVLHDTMDVLMAS